MAKLYSIRKGASLVDEILGIARKEGIKCARMEAIGGVERLTIAYFNRRRKKYEEHEYEEFLEVAGILGNITLKDGKPFLHAHGVFGRKDMSTIGGHVVSARVFPLLEVIITPTSNGALRRFDDEMGLNVIYKMTE